MKKIPLTQGKFALVDDEDYEFLMQWKWYPATSPTSKTYYALRNGYSKKKTGGDGRNYSQKMHRVIMKCYLHEIVDHINGNGLDNQKSNLRKVTKSQNGMNRGMDSRNTTGFKGVHFYKSRNKYTANIRCAGKSKCLGYFETPEEAHEAYKKAALELHGEFAKWD